MFVITDIKKICHALFLCVFRVYSHIKFHTLSTNISINIAIKPKLNINFARPPCCCFIYYKEVTLTKVAYFAKLRNHTEFHNPYTQWR